jgi:hypothetical protein
MAVFNSGYTRVLVTLDRFLSMGLGRPAAIQSEEYVDFITLYRSNSAYFEQD